MRWTLRSEISGDRVIIDLVGPTSPPSSTDLVTKLNEVMGVKVDLRMRWSQRVIIGDPAATAIGENERVRQVADAWATSLTETEVYYLERRSMTTAIPPTTTTISPTTTEPTGPN